MKNRILICAVTTASMHMMLFADTLRIGTFTLPYRIEDSDISDIVRYVVTNDVIAYNAATTSFTPPFLEKSGGLSVRQETTPDTNLYRPPVFENGIKFYIENGQTNCVIKRSLTDAAKAMEADLPLRTNLAHSVQRFIDTIIDGSITNNLTAVLRLRTRVYKNGVLHVATESEGSDNDMRQNFTEMREHSVFFPPCILTSYYKPSGTNNYFCIKVAYDTPNEPDYARSIAAFPFVYVDGYWCLCFE